MKESIPLLNSAGMADLVQNWLSTDSKSDSIPRLSQKPVFIGEAKEIEESSEKREQSAPLPTTEEIVESAIRIIDNYQDNSLGTILEKINVPMPKFKRLFIGKYNQVRDDENNMPQSNKDVIKSTIWYGLTEKLELTRYYYSPRTSKLIIERNTSLWRINELIGFLKLPHEKVTNSYGEDQITPQIEILAQAMDISEEDALRMILNLSNKEVSEEYTIK